MSYFLRPQFYKQMILCNHEGGQVMKLKDRINEFLREKQYTEEEILFMDSSSVYIAATNFILCSQKSKKIKRRLLF